MYLAEIQIITLLFESEAVLSSMYVICSTAPPNPPPLIAGDPNHSLMCIKGYYMLRFTN